MAESKELTREQLYALRKEIDELGKRYDLYLGDFFYQVASYAWTDFLRLVEAAAKGTVAMPPDENGYKEAVEANKKAIMEQISSEAGVEASLETKRNTVSPQLISSLSIKLWKLYGDKIRAVKTAEKEERKKAA